MYADAVLSAILQAEAIGGNVSKSIPLPALKMDRSHFKVSFCVIFLLLHSKVEKIIILFYFFLDDGFFYMLFQTVLKFIFLFRNV